MTLKRRLGGVRLTLLIVTMIVFGACNSRLTPDQLPTRIPSIEIVATGDALTAVAPPEGLRDGVRFPNIDDNLVFVANWRSESRFRFDGVFVGTAQTIDAQTDINIWYNQVGNQRRVVVIDESGELSGSEGVPSRREGVRLGGETFLLLDGACFGSANGDAALVSDLRIGDVLGGVMAAVPAGEQRVLHGLDVWRYDFDFDALNLPLIQTTESSVISGMQGELWVARVSPNQNVVVRYYLNLQVESVAFTLFGASPPVTGVLQLRYDLYDVGINPNITAPNGC